MSSGQSFLRGAALLLLLGGCARPTEVELRLFPCGLAGASPVAVDLDVQGYDAAGAALKPLRASFAVADGVLGDGYATVGLRRPSELARADFSVTWHDAAGVAQVVMHPGLAVPEVGEVLELGAEMCAPFESTSSGDVSTSSSTSSDPSTSSSTSTGPDPSTSTGASTGSDTTGEPTMIGEDCILGPQQYFCEGGGPGQLGTLLACVGNKWIAGDLDTLCKIDIYCPATLGLIDPVPVGCSGVGSVGWGCVCQDKQPLPCLLDEAGCTGNTKVTLCIEDDQGIPIRTKGVCVSCKDEDPAGPLCKP